MAQASYIFLEANSFSRVRVECAYPRNAVFADKNVGILYISRMMVKGLEIAILCPLTKQKL